MILKMQQHIVRKVKKFNPRRFSLDKAYDIEKIHEELGATSMIPRKKGAKNGKYRMAMNHYSVNQNIIKEALQKQ